MLALSRVGMLVEASAVEAIEPVAVAREMRRHPVDDYADARLMEPIDHEHEILRRAITAGRRIIAHGLIAPASGKWMLAHREKLDVRVAHLPAIVDELRRDLAVAQPAIRIVGGPPPASQMHFIGRDGGIERVGLF